VLSCTLGQIIAHTPKGLPEKSNREREPLALAGTKSTSTALTTPADEPVLLGDSSAVRSSTLWQTIKPFGWPMCGLIVYFCGGALLRPMAFPLAFLLFAIPIPVLIYNEIVFPLQFVASCGLQIRNFDVGDAQPVSHHA
jgi:hypothetical protein